MNGVVTVNIPTQALKYQYGVYEFSVQLTDANGTQYVVTKTRNVCQQPDDVNGCVSAVEMVASCINGTLTILVAEPPVYQGQLSESKTQNWTVYYPTASGLTSFTTAISNFSVRLFEGVYRVVGSICATYNFGDHVYIRLGFGGDFEKNVKCLLDYTCIFPRLQQLGRKLNEDCSDADRLADASLVLSALWLIKKSELALAAGEDASEDIAELEDLLGCKCTCECSASSPIVNNSPSTNFQIEGCNVVKTTVGLTDHYQIENYEFLIETDPTQNILTVSAPALDSCTKTQVLSFSIANAYAGIKTQIGDITEYNYWASVVNKVLDSIDGTCILADWETATFNQRIAAMVAKSCECCDCEATITSSSTTQDGADVTLTYVQSGAFSVEVYVDGALVGTQLSENTSILLSGYADGQTHDYVLIPLCSNGSRGTVSTGDFAYVGCPSISAPTVSTNNPNGVPCPYDLTALVTSPPVGITVEWHTANNTLPGTLVPDPENVSDGVYYAFAKDSNGCYSTSTVVTLTCASETSCTAPQSLLVTAAVGGFLVQFQSAAFPPPLNSYTVKRRLASDPDVSGSYTTIGTPTFNSGTSRWEILDATAVNNVLYVYRAISNCSSTTPSVDYQFANITCPSISTESSMDDIDYSFTPLGGGIDKYEVKLYDNSGVTLLQMNTHLPSFSNPVTGTFLYLTAGTSYKIRVRVYIGTYFTDCPLQIVNTTSGAGIENELRLGVSDLSVCGQPVSIVYSDIPFGPGAFMYNDIGLTDPVTDYNWIADNFNYWSLDPLTGEVGGLAGSCAP
jgi:hypothetical protein